MPDFEISFGWDWIYSYRRNGPVLVWYENAEPICCAISDKEAIALEDNYLLVSNHSEFARID